MYVLMDVFTVYVVIYVCGRFDQGNYKEVALSRKKYLNSGLLN